MAPPVPHSHGARRFRPAVRKSLCSNPKAPGQYFAHKSVDGELVVLNASEGCFLTVQKRAHGGGEQAGMEHSFDSDVVLLAVAKSTSQQEKGESKKAESQDAQEDTCTEFGFEYINYSTEGKNEFGEKMGFERLKEALEANEWADDGEEELGLDELGLDTEDGEDGFGHEEAEMTAELFGMKAALGANEDDDAEELITPQQQAGGVEDLDRMLGKLLAVKEQSADLPEEQRKRMAAKAVRELMMEKPNV